jgi:predicted transcriptional regulator
MGSKKASRQPGLGPLESAVMAAVWMRASATVREVHSSLARERKVAYTTVMTTMARLHSKGLLLRAKDGNAYRYAPRLDRGGWLQRFARKTIDALLPHLDPASVAYFVEEASKTNPELVKELRRALEEHESE